MKRLSRPSPVLSGLVLLALPMVVTACNAAVQVAPAPHSTDPACAPVMIALPDRLAGQQLRATTSQATAAWGDPSTVILRCGVHPPEPSTDRCVSVNGVDWLVRPLQSPRPAPSSDTAHEVYTVTTYGRTPAIELVFSEREVSSSDVLAQISSVVTKIPQQRKCLNLNDATPNGSAAPNPS